MINNHLQYLAASPTLAMSTKAKELEAQGHNVIHLSVGEPDIPPPFWVGQAAVQAIESGQHRYTPVGGTLPLKKAILTKTARENALDGYEPSQVIVSTGAKQVIYNALMASLNTDDEVLIPCPYWVSYPAIVHLARGRSIFLPCNDQFKITADILEKAITPRTRWLILNSPSNPSGVVYTAEDLSALAHILRRYPDILIMSDDIYEHLIFDNHPFVNILNVAPDLKDRVLIVNGVSKSLSLTGWRLGWGIGPRPLVQAMEKLQSHCTSGPCCIVQTAVEKTLNACETLSFFHTQKRVFQERRNCFLEVLKGIEGFECFCPQGAFYFFVDVQKLFEHPKVKQAEWKTDTDLAYGLLDTIHISSVPGSEFGMPGYLRFSYAVEENLLREAGQRLKDFFSC